MTKAYLQNKKAKYYYIADDGTVQLSDVKTPLRDFPQIMDADDALTFATSKFKDYKQTGFIFRNDGLRILSHIFFRKGTEGDCVLTLEPGQDICGDLDFSTARIYDGKEIRICCIHF